MRSHGSRVFLVAITVLLLGAGCGAPANNGLTYSGTAPLLPEPSLQKQAAPSGPLSLTSTAFADGQPIPETYSCKGQDFSPPLAFGNVPANAVSLALIVRDADAAYDHWTVFNMPPDATGISEGDIPPGPVGTSTGGRIGYEGPCPPEGSAHHYVFTLYALDTALSLQDGVQTADVSNALQGHVLASAVLTGTFAATVPDASPPAAASSTAP